MKRIQLELTADGDVVEQMKKASDFVSYINDSLKPDGGKAYVIQTRGLTFLDGSQQILVEIAKSTLPTLISIFGTYFITNAKAKIKFKRGTTSIELPSERLSDEQIEKFVHLLSHSDTKDRNHKKNN
jgi:hypothetical protein